jgi:hypothetical protein
MSRKNSSQLSRKSDKVSAKDDKLTSEAKDTDKKDQVQAPKEEDESKTGKQDGAQEKSANKLTKQEKQEPKIVIEEIQVIPFESTDDDHDDKGKFNRQGKLLGARAQRNKRVLQLNGKASRVKREVPLDAISCISDYSMISNIDYQKVKKGKARDRTGAATPLTFKSLKDFTNSPEGNS